MPTIKNGDLLKRLREQGMNIPKVDDIAIARKELGHPIYDSEMTDEEAAAVENYFKNHQPDAKSQDTAKPKGKASKPVKKSHVNHEDRGLAIAQATDAKNKTLVKTGLISGAQDANILNQGYQLGFADQYLQNTKSNATAIAQQLLGLQDRSYEGLTIDSSEVLEMLPSAVEDGEEDPLGSELYKQPAGLGFAI